MHIEITVTKLNKLPSVVHVLRLKDNGGSDVRQAGHLLCATKSLGVANGWCNTAPSFCQSTGVIPGLSFDFDEARHTDAESYPQHML